MTKTMDKETLRWKVTDGVMGIEFGAFHVSSDGDVSDANDSGLSIEAVSRALRHLPDYLDFEPSNDYMGQLAPLEYNANVDELVYGPPVWAPVNGYSAQHGYKGPVMHLSEYVGGSLALDMARNPGLYALLPVEVDCELQAEFCEAYGQCDCEPAGWMLLRHVGH